MATKVKKAAKKAAKKGPKIRTEEITENLKCMLTDDELKGVSEATAKLIQEKSQLEKDKKSAMASFKAKVDAADAGIIDNSNKIRDKYEYRDILCEKKLNFTDHTVKVIRTDINTVIESRKMDLREKQSESLFD